MHMKIESINSDKKHTLEYKLTDDDLSNISAIIAGWLEASYLVVSMDLTKDYYKGKMHKRMKIESIDGETI